MMGNNDTWKCKCGMVWGNFDYYCPRCGNSKESSLNSLNNISVDQLYVEDINNHLVK